MAILITISRMFLIVLIILLIDQGSSYYIISKPNNNRCHPHLSFEDSQIIFVRSATINNYRERQISIYWYNSDFQNGDIIAVYRGRPEQNSQPLWQFEPITASGFVRTNLQISLLKKYPLTSYKEELLDYCGAWLRDNSIKKLNCYLTHPTWMYDKRNILKNKKLPYLMIPGTYMSGSYLKNLPDLESTTEKFKVTQNQDILTQLIYGVRYLDISVGHYPKIQNKYWVIHNNKKMNTLKQIIMDIRFFLNRTNEIVMLNFRDFSEGFNNNDDHKEFVNYLEQIFTGYYLKKQNSNDEWNITMEEIWNLDKRLIIIYDHFYQLTRKSLWSSPWCVNMFYKSDMDYRNYIIGSEETFSFFYTIGERLNRQVLRIMYLTISSQINIEELEKNCNKTCIQNHPDNPRRFADEIAPIITSSYNEVLYLRSNIIAAKFIDATGLIDIAITWNERRFSGCLKR